MKKFWQNLPAGSLIRSLRSLGFLSFTLQAEQRWPFGLATVYL